jgi:large repetitive protein
MKRLGLLGTLTVGLTLLACSSSEPIEPTIPAAVTAVAVTPDHLMLIEQQAATIAATARDAEGNVVTGQSFTWSTNDSTIAVVDANGRITAKRAGSAEITVRTAEITAKVFVTVNQVPVALIKAGPTALVLAIGATKQLFAITYDAAGNVLTGRIVNWSTDSPSVATVDDSELVTAVGHGYATIIVASEGRTFGVAVTVSPQEP